MKPMYTAHVTSQGGRNGQVKSSDGILDLAVSTPKEMGGKGGSTNPEQLFAAGYAACYENALIFIAQKQKLELKSTKVTAHVSIGANTAGGFMLATKLEIELPGIPREQGQALVDAAHQVCPYSNATRGNMEVELVLL